MNKQKETGMNFSSALVLSTRHDVDHDENEDKKWRCEKCSALDASCCFNLL